MTKNKSTKNKPVRKKYTREFKLKIIKKVVSDNSKSIRQIAEENNISHSGLYKWFIKYKPEVQQMLNEQQESSVITEKEPIIATKNVKELTKRDIIKDVSHEISDLKIELAAVIKDVNLLYTAYNDNITETHNIIKTSNIFFEKQLGEIKDNIQNFDNRLDDYYSILNNFDELVRGNMHPVADLGDLERNILKMALPIILKLINQIENNDD
jgi:transposase-like protein